VRAGHDDSFTAIAYTALLLSNWPLHYSSAPTHRDRQKEP
jgi:hypothetical protein